MPTVCVIPGCDACAADPGALPLCGHHVAMAAEAHGGVHGVTDLLPAPCACCGARLGLRLPSGWICTICEWPLGEHPDGDLAPPRLDVVYYLRFGDRVKIGTTANPRRRFTAIRHEEVLALERGDRRVEQRRHAQFADERLGTEWFALSERLRRHIDALAAGVDPWDRWRRWQAEAAAASAS